MRPLRRSSVKLLSTAKSSTSSSITSTSDARLPGAGSALAAVPAASAWGHDSDADDVASGGDNDSDGSAVAADECSARPSSRLWMPQNKSYASTFTSQNQSTNISVYRIESALAALVIRERIGNTWCKGDARTDDLRQDLGGDQTQTTHYDNIQTTEPSPPSAGTRTR